jgi:anti-sigma factor RsiW
MKSEREPSCARNEDALALLAGGDLPEEEARALRAHVAGCGACDRELAELQAALAWARHAEPSPFVAEDLATLHRRVLADLAAAPPPRRPLLERLVAALRPGRFALVTAGVAAALLVAIVGREGRVGPPVLDSPALEPLAPAPLGTLAAPDAGEEATGDPTTLAALAAANEGELDPQLDVVSHSHPLKIELRTGDPKIRIVWLAGR